MIRLVPLLVAALIPLAALLSGGCDPVYLDLSSCGTSHPGPSCPKEETCPGQCVTIPPLGGWERPALLWFGPVVEAPACPADRAPIVGYEGYADPEPSAPPECPTCSCDPPTGECEPPSFLTASTDTCPDDDPQAMHWDFSGLGLPGSCNAGNPVSAGQGQSSVTIEPLTLIETGCKPSSPPPPNEGAQSWKTFARACLGNPSSCLDPGKVCVPAPPPPPPGFFQCIFQKGDQDCPEDYPAKHVFFDEAYDSRRCSDCSCAAPEGGACSATVMLFQDGSCSVMASGMVPVSSSEPQCVPIVQGLSLGGKKMTEPSYTPGTCEPIGGDPTGSVELKGPSTFCCQ